VKELLGFNDVEVLNDPLHNPFCSRYFNIHKELKGIPKQTITKQEYYQAQKPANKKRKIKTTS